MSTSEWDEQEQQLLEMFPKCSVTEARSALSIAKGDMEEAVRLIIEGDVQLSPTPPLSVSNHGEALFVSGALYYSMGVEWPKCVLPTVAQKE